MGIVCIIANSTRSIPTATLLERQSQRVSVWALPYNGTLLKAVYDCFHNEIITFLTFTQQNEELMAA